MDNYTDAIVSALNDDRETFNAIVSSILDKKAVASLDEMNPLKTSIEADTE